VNSATLDAVMQVALRCGSLDRDAVTSV